MYLNVYETHALIVSYGRIEFLHIRIGFSGETTAPQFAAFHVVNVCPTAAVELMQLNLVSQIRKYRVWLPHSRSLLNVLVTGYNQ